MSIPDGPYSKDIKDCHKYLRDRWPTVKEMFERKTGRKLVITCTWRSLKEQERLYAKGRTEPGPKVTWTLQSNHNLYPSRALDVAVIKGKKAVWGDDEYGPLLAICKLNDLICGGEWDTPDWPHIEMPKEVV